MGYKTVTMTRSEQDACVRALERELGARVRCDPEQLARHAWDFGKLIHRPPAAVVSVHSREELQTALRIGAAFRVAISTRGSGHSQSGQCLASGGIVLDMKALNAVQIDTEAGCAWLDAGATWHRVANAAYAESHLPVGLTMIVDTTVGGTLSVGGYGTESFRTGTQADQVLELEVALLDGTLRRCSPARERELYDAMRAGVGQCGVIVRARYPLRRAKSRIRTHTLAYGDRSKLLADMQALSAAPQCQLMFAGLLWSEQRGWQMLLMLGSEFDEASELSDTSLLCGLHHAHEVSMQDDPQWHADGTPGHRFFRVYGAANAGAAHCPWPDHLCEPRVASELLDSVCSEPAVAPRAGTCAGLLSVAAHPNRAPLILPRATGPLVLLGLFPEPSSADLPATLARLRRHSERGCALGGKRYLSGFIDGWGAAEWSQHFGDRWPWFHSIKERYDPHALLNRGFIQWT